MLLGILVAAGMLAWFTAARLNAQVPKDDGYLVDSFHADYVLDPSGAGGHLEVTETIQVTYANGVESHGFYRTLPITNQGSSTPVSGFSVTRDGEPESFTSQSMDTALDIRIGSSYTEVTGTHTYVLTYVYGGVIQDYQDHQELYWDVNGLSWTTSISSVSATLTVPASISDSLTGDAACYVGEYGDGTPCTIAAEDSFSAEGEPVVVFRTETVEAPYGTNQTFAVGFAPGTFERASMAASTKDALTTELLITGILAAIALTMLIAAATRQRRAMSHQPLVVQFTPRADLPPVLAAGLMGEPGRGLVAELLRAASERHVKLTGGGDSGEPLMAELVSWPEGWQEASQTALSAIFRSKQPGTTVDVRSRLGQLSDSTIDEILALAPDAGLVWLPKMWTPTGAIVLSAAIGGYLIVHGGIVSALPFWWIAIPLLITAVSLAAIYGLVLRWQTLTVKGKEAFGYLNGLRTFLAASEADRMKVVQGAETSQRVGSDQLVPIFEKLLPYAVALGVEDSWQQAVGTDLEQGLTWLPTGGISPTRLGLASSNAYRRPGGYLYDNTRRNPARTIFDQNVPEAQRRAWSAAAGSDRGHSSSWSSSSRSSGGSRGGGHSGGGGGGGGGRRW